jgi:hypothetical protein
MVFSDQNTQVFIVRLWCEHREIEGAAPEWRVMIEHVPTGDRRYLRRVTEITDFMKHYMRTIDPRRDIRSRATGLLRYWRRWIRR